jgi:ribose transport system substrate-binding protein
MNRSARAIGCALVAGGLAVLAACSTNADSSSSDGQPVNAASKSDLQAKVDAKLAAPTGVGLSTPLTKQPAADKSVVGILTSLATAKVESAAQGEAAELLGWRYKEIQQGSGPEDAAKALDAAVALKPDGIIYYGAPRQLMEAGLQKAKAANIAVVATAQTDPLAPPIIANNSNSGEQLKDLGVGVADYVALDSDLRAKVALVTIPAFPVLKSFGDAFKNELKSACPDCKVTDVPQQLTDLGTVTPTSVVSALRRDPKIKYVIFDCGCASAGVEAAIQAAGLKDVVLGGEAPLANTIAELKRGSDQAWAALSLPILGYGLIDTLARHFNGESLDPVVKEKPAWQILTKDNIGTAAIDAQNNYLGYADYGPAFGKLWKVSQ